MADAFEDLKCGTDLAFAIAAEIMKLEWTNHRDIEVHCNRYGELQEAADRVLKVYKIVPTREKREDLPEY
jgi:hypothetical protein